MVRNEQLASHGIPFLTSDEILFVRDSLTNEEKNYDLRKIHKKCSIIYLITIQDTAG